VSFANPARIILGIIVTIMLVYTPIVVKGPTVLQILFLIL
jgi:hypothetical protein